jgi:4-nitrophenol 2-monooxygenase / 4-nitrocatechol 4-monooxygenase, reductase component
VGTPDTSRSRRLTSDEFRDVIGHFASGVTVVTVSVDDRPYGTTASAVTSLALEPPMLLVCMSRESATGRAMATAGAFAVNILGEDHGELATRFARKGGDKFDGVELAEGEHGQPLLADAIAQLECRVTEQVAAGTHTVFIAEVQSATARPGAPPLAYFRGRFGRLELPEAAETPDAADDGRAARRAIELGVVDVTVGRVGVDEVTALRQLMEAGDGAAFGEFLVGLAGSDALLSSYRRLPGVESDEADLRGLVEAYEAGDLERARAVLLRGSS